MRRGNTQYTADQRSRLIDLARSGTTIAAAAAELGVTASTAYQWVRAARPAASRGMQESGRGSPRPARPQFARLVPSDARGATVVVRVAGAAIEVRPGFDAELLRQVIAVLGGGPT